MNELHYDHFLFVPGIWEGKGKVSFSFSPDELYFDMYWSVYEKDQGGLCCLQKVIIDGQDPMVNTFAISSLHENHFSISLENAALGSFQGAGIVEPGSAAWEFRYPGVLDGYEIYERLSENEYSMRAEYCGEDVRTIISGVLKLALHRT